MTQAVALEMARDLKSHIDKWWKKTTCSIELVAGRGSDPWVVPKKPLRMHHHTAAAYRGTTGNLTPALYICKHGRSDVPGPLCNGYGGFDLRYRIICMGLANHPGAGGPITIDGVYIPKDSARTPTWGTEWEGGLQDYETIPGMMDFMGAVDCALAEFGMLGVARPLTSQMEHKTWAPLRKIDRREFDRARGIALTQAMYNKYRPTAPTTGDWFDMATKAELEAILQRKTGAFLAQPIGRPQVFMVASDLQSKWWIGGWENVAIGEYIDDLIDAGLVNGHRKPIALSPAFMDQIPELWNPVLGYSYAPKEGGKVGGPPSAPPT